MNKARILAHMKDDLKTFSVNSNYVGYINKLNEQQCKDILYNINSVLMNLGNRISNDHPISIRSQVNLNLQETEFIMTEENGREVKRSVNLLNLLFQAEL